MPDKNKNDKDSYAKDTLAFSVPLEERKHPNEQINNSVPNQNYHQQNSHSQGQRPQGQYQQNPHPQSQRPQGQYQQNPHPQSQRPQGQYQQNPHPQGQRPQGQYQQNPHPQSQRPQAQRPIKQSQQTPKPKNNKKQTQLKPKQPKQKKSKTKIKLPKFGCLTKIIISLVSIFLVVFIAYSAIAFALINQVNIVDSEERQEPSHELYTSSSVKNVLLIGTDSRGKDRGRSDSMIILSINSKTNKMTLVSLMRDSYVQIPGHGSGKLNSAYSKGGPELLMDTIEENFYIEIDDYLTVNFISFANIVDVVGGVEIEVSDEEADAINELLDSKEGNKLFGKPKESDYLKGGGKYKLTGKQALCYSRLRYVGNADFERTERQRTVITEIIKSATTMNPFKIGGATKDVLPSMNTNMSKMDMYFLFLRAPSLILGYDIEQLRIPAENTYNSSTIGGQSVLEIDIQKNLDIIEKELY